MKAYAINGLFFKVSQDILLAWIPRSCFFVKKQICPDLKIIHKTKYCEKLAKGCKQLVEHWSVSNPREWIGCKLLPSIWCNVGWDHTGEFVSRYTLASNLAALLLGPAHTSGKTRNCDHVRGTYLCSIPVYVYMDMDSAKGFTVVLGCCQMDWSGLLLQLSTMQLSGKEWSRASWYSALR